MRLSPIRLRFLSKGEKNMNSVEQSVDFLLRKNVQLQGGYYAKTVPSSYE